MEHRKLDKWLCQKETIAIIWTEYHLSSLYIKFGVLQRSSVPIEICRELCLNNCSCIAYAYDASIGCMTWTKSLIDIEKFSSGGVDLYIRLAHSELAKKDNKVLIIVPTVVGIITFAICAFFL
ncbi:hypothetical protein ACOSQ2_027297 [Xanthoceras sorbifolium]